MYLDCLRVLKGAEVIRKINFRTGLNLVIDDTTSSTPTDSGNNVGKTTFLRAIDFCLGGNKKDIYTDREFKKKDQKIYDFLNKNGIVFELQLKSRKGTIHTILRPINGKSSLNGKEYSSEVKLKDAIQEVLFGCSGGRPTLSQLMNKFIRIEEYQIVNALNFLFMADDSEYEALFMFLFGFRNNELLGKKKKKVDEVKKLKKNLDSSDYKIEDLEQQVFLIDKEIKELSEAKNSFNFSPTVDKELSELKFIQGDISKLRDQLAKLNLRIILNKQSLTQLEKSKSKVGEPTIKKLYAQTKIEFDTLKKKFEDVLSFHNNMVNNKISYLESIIDKVDSKIKSVNRKLQDKIKKEETIVNIMSTQGALGEYDKMSLKLQEKNKDKGNREGLIESLKSLNSQLENVQKVLDSINKKIKTFEDEFKTNLSKFNVYFSKFSEKLYGDQYYLSHNRSNNRTTDNFLLEIGNLKENVGTGKKKAQISALDLAYLKYSEESEHHMPLFMLHDQLETVFENQIETLFDIANSLSGQFIVAVLSDKLHNIEKDKIESNRILSLSQNDKFFKIP